MSSTGSAAELEHGSADTVFSEDGLTSREAARRLVSYGPNALDRRGGRQWPRALLRQLTHPLALLLWLAAVLAAVAGTPVLSAAIVAVIVINAVLAFFQEEQAEHAVEALAEYLPPRARVIRDAREIEVDAREVVPGDVLLVEEGDRICADAVLTAGSVEVDLSAMTGESVPQLRSALTGEERLASLATAAAAVSNRLESQNRVFSGTVCTGGEARGVVLATGMRTELGRIAGLSQRVRQEPSPLERQVRRVARLIAIIALGMAVAFVPLGVLLAGLSLQNSVIFAIGLMVGNVPEGLLPTITLALAIGVRLLARRGALVKRLSAVETLGSTTVICTDKTGTLTQNRMEVRFVWTCNGEWPLDRGQPQRGGGEGLRRLAEASALCSNAHLEDGDAAHAVGDPTEVAMLAAAGRLGADVGSKRRDEVRRRQFHFDPGVRLMSTVDEIPGGLPRVHVKGAAESVLPLCTSAVVDGVDVELDDALRARIRSQAEGYARGGLRVLAVADRPLAAGEPIPEQRAQAERGLSFLGLMAMFDPPRPEIRAAVEACHAAGIRVLMITGDAGLTAAGIAAQVGIGSPDTTIISGPELDRMSEAALDELLMRGDELIFSRSSPEAKLRIADALRSLGEVVAMTGDGVNDAPALHRADIGVAMGRGGTDVAREAAAMILVDDNFASIVAAVESGRQVYDNVRKFIGYIFAHAVPEVLPFLVFAFSGGLIPAPITPIQILQIDLLTDTAPALALGREPAEPGIMSRRPRPPKEGVITRRMLVRSWGYFGVISGVLSMSAFLVTMVRAGWSPGDDVAAGHPLHQAYLQATTMTFLAIVACQVGVAFAARSDHLTLRRLGLFTNPMLLYAVAVELCVAALLVILPPLEAVFGNATPTPAQALVLLPIPLVILAADSLQKLVSARRAPT